MKTPSPDAKRGFDNFFASSEGHEDLCQRLDAAIRQQQEATPEPSSSDHESLEEDYRWQCNILHDHFKSSDMIKCGMPSGNLTTGRLNASTTRTY